MVIPATEDAQELALLSGVRATKFDFVHNIVVRVVVFDLRRKRNVVRIANLSDDC